MGQATLETVELPSLTAHELTRAFYSKAFGWSFDSLLPDLSASEAGSSTLVLNGSPDDSLSAPLPVIRVDDLGAALDKVADAGGVLAKPIFSHPNGRRFHFIDPSGNELAVAEIKSNQPGVERTTTR